MRACGRCGGALRPGARFCPRCGHAVAPPAPRLRRRDLAVYLTLGVLLLLLAASLLLLAGRIVPVSTQTPTPHVAATLTAAAP